MRRLGRLISEIDWLLIGPTVFLVVIGLVVQFSIAQKTKGPQIDINMQSQILGLAAGFAIGVGLHVSRVSSWKLASRYIYFATLVLLALVVLIGVEANGAQRWLLIGGVQLQPSELAKVVMIGFLAQIFSVGRLRANSFMTVVKSIVVAGLPIGLVMLQPDLGSAIVFVIIWATIIFNSKLQLSRFSLMVMAIIASALVLTPFLAEYQQARLISYFNADSDLSGANYNVEQAKIAIGNGGLLGNGLEGGSQSQLNFLPSQHTDFIYAVTAEKLGLLGAGAVLVAFAMLYSRMIYIAWRTDSEFEGLIIVGVVALMFFHTLINIGMNLGLVPVTGLPLPFVSFGGTFALVSVVCVLAVHSSAQRVESSGL